MKDPVILITVNVILICGLVAGGDNLAWRTGLCGLQILCIILVGINYLSLQKGQMWNSEAEKDRSISFTFGVLPVVLVSCYFFFFEKAQWLTYVLMGLLVGVFCFRGYMDKRLRSESLFVVAAFILLFTIAASKGMPTFYER